MEYCTYIVILGSIGTLEFTLYTEANMMQKIIIVVQDALIDPANESSKPDDV